jgi:hypothetical protein
MTGQTKKWSFPRRFSKAHCMSKSCDKMGFTEKASCRPYKNCYHGGRMTTRKNSPKKTDKRSKATVRANNHPRMIYESTHTTFTSHPAKGEPHGVRTTVSLKNGEGVKKIEALNKRGKTIKSKSAPIHNSHFNEIKNGKYVPGLWDI